MILISIFIALLLQFASCAPDTTRAERQKQFTETCDTPKPFQTFDLKWFFASNPNGGYYNLIANDITRLHFGEILQGKLLTPYDSFTDSCFRTSVQLGSNGLEANVTGFNGCRATWDCRPSKVHSGVFACDGVYGGPSKFQEYFNIYPVYSDHKNFKLGAACFPNGEAGWFVLSVTPTLSYEDKNIIAEKVNQLGFRYEDHVTTFSGSCSK